MQSFVVTVYPRLISNVRQTLDTMTQSQYEQVEVFSLWTHSSEQPRRSDTQICLSFHKPILLLPLSQNLNQYANFEQFYWVISIYSIQFRQLSSLSQQLTARDIDVLLVKGLPKFMQQYDFQYCFLSDEERYKHILKSKNTPVGTRSNSVF